MSDTRRILSIDGGGINGTLPIAFLARVEEVTGERIVDHFDLIAGTSTGGIIAIALALGVPASAVLSFYRNDGPTIFGAQADVGKGPLGQRVLTCCHHAFGRAARTVRQIIAPKHGATGLRQRLELVFGNKLIGDSLTRLVIPAYHPDRRSVYVFKTSHHERFEVDHAALAVDVALATTAAPTYFPAHRLPSGARIIDGGIWANNPMGVAVVEAIGVLGWDRTKVKLLSLGCRDEVFVPRPNPGVVQLGFDAIDLLMQGQSFGAIGTAKIFLGEDNVHRICPIVPKGLFALDDVRNIERLAGMGAESARDALPMLRREFFGRHRHAFIPYHGCRSVSGAKSPVNAN